MALNDDDYKALRSLGDHLKEIIEVLGSMAFDLTRIAAALERLAPPDRKSD